MMPVMWCPDLWCQTTARRTSQRASLMLPMHTGRLAVHARHRSGKRAQGCGPRMPRANHAVRVPPRRRTPQDLRRRARPGAHLSTAVTPAAGKRHSTCQRSRRSRRLKQLLLRARRSMPGCCRCRATPRARACARRAGLSARGRRRERPEEAALLPRGARRCARAGPPLAATLEWHRAPGQVRNILLRHNRPVRGQHRLLQPRRALVDTSEARRRRRFAQHRPGARAARRAERAGAHTWCASSCWCGGGAARRRSGAARCAASPAAAASSRKR